MSLLHKPIRRTIVCAALLAGIATGTAAFADVKDGVEAYERGEYAKAIAEWQPLAIKGNADAQFNLAQAYKLGRGVPMDTKIAESWYRKAAEQGHLQAEDNLGLVMFNNGKRAEAMPYIQKSAERGEPRAQYVLGTATFNGDLAPKDWVRAYALMTRASSAGLSTASARLAQFDTLIPLEERQRGLSLAAGMEQTEAQARLAAMQASPVPVRTAAPSPIRTASIPPSIPSQKPPVYAPQSSAPGTGAGARFPTPPMSGETEEAQSMPSTPPIAAPPVSATPRPATRPAVSAPVRATSGGKWRVQLGAFGTEAKARALWTSLEGRYPSLSSLQPFLVKAGAVTRLQAGPFATKAEADRACGVVSSGGQACFSMAN
jgi:cell division septation protein DedD